MNPVSVRTRYHPVSIGLHWLTLALLIAIYALIEFRGVFPKGTSAHDAMKMWHEMLGLSVFAIVAARLAWRWLVPAPRITPAPPAWQGLAAKAMHAALYAFLIVMPVLGWLTLSAKGKPIPFFGLDLPPLLGANKALGHRIEDIHEMLGTLGYYLIGAHAAAALFHHYVQRDDTLRRMLPTRRARRAPANAAVVDARGPAR